jgi:hypothetical protein
MHNFNNGDELRDHSHGLAIFTLKGKGFNNLQNLQISLEISYVLI